MLNRTTGDELWKYTDPSLVDHIIQVAFSPVANLVVAVVQDDRAQPDRYLPRLLVFSAADGTLLETVVPGSGDCKTMRTWPGMAFSPDGSLFQVTTGGDCADDPASDWVALYDTTTWEEVARIDHGHTESVSFSTDMSRVLVRGDDVPAELRSWPEMEVLQRFTLSHTAALSPDGSLVALGNSSGRSGGTPDFRPRLYDADTGELLDVLADVDGFHHAGLAFSSDGSLLYLGTRSGDVVWDVSTRRTLYSLSSGSTPWLSATSDGQLLATAQTDGQVLMWDLAEAALGAPVELQGASAIWFNADWIFEGTRTFALVLAEGESGDLETWLAVIDPQSGTVLRELRTTAQGQLPDGRFVVVPRTTGPDGEPLAGPLGIWDPDTGAITPLTDCVVPRSGLDGSSDTRCPDGTRFFGDTVVVSEDGSEFAVINTFWFSIF